MSFEELKEKSLFHIKQIVEFCNDSTLSNVVMNYLEMDYNYPISNFTSLTLSKLRNCSLNSDLEYITTSYESMFCACEIRRMFSVYKMFQKESFLSKLSPKQIATLTGSVNKTVYFDIINSDSIFHVESRSKIIQIFLDTFGIEGRIKAEALELDLHKRYLENNSNYPEDISVIANLMEGNIYSSIIKSMKLCDNCFIYDSEKDYMIKACALIAKRNYLSTLINLIDKDIDTFKMQLDETHRNLKELLN